MNMQPKSPSSSATGKGNQKVESVLAGLPFFVASLLLCLLTAMSAYGQVSTATLNGVVQDAGGGLVPNATVVLTQTDTNAQAKAVTNDRGSFSLQALPVGPYVLSVTAPASPPISAPTSSSP